MQKIEPMHLGEVLKTEFLEAFNITAYKLAKDIHVPVNRITEIINGQRNISTETALMLSIYFGLSSGFWIRMQSYYDEVVTKDKINNLLSAIKPISTLPQKFATSPS